MNGTETQILALLKHNLDVVTKVSIIILFVFAVYFIFRFVVLKTIMRVLKAHSHKWYDIIHKRRALSIVYTLPPVLIIYYGMQFFPAAQIAVSRVMDAYIILNIVFFFTRFMRSLEDIYSMRDFSATKPIKGYVQLAEIFVVTIGIVLAVCAFLGKSPLAVLSGIGAMTAVLMLIFKDTIVNFVASVLIVFDDLVHEGDWIEVYGTEANGVVIDIALHSVKVKNFDNTIVSLPTYKLVDGSFKNWRGMQETGGRRIERAILIDQSTISFLSDNDITRLSEIKLLKDYLKEKVAEIEEANKNISEETAVNGRHLTNIGTFRIYVTEYLKSRKDIDKNETLMARLLTPTSNGIPLEIYAFSSVTDFVLFEGVQSDIFDHLLSVIDEFGLKVFQIPSGNVPTEITGQIKVTNV